MSMDDENINNKESSPPRSLTNIGNQITSTKKSNQGHVGGRPRSKSLDLSKIHKKNTAHHHHQHYKHGQYPLHYGRSSPSSPKLTGKCWVRKATTTSPTSFVSSRAIGATTTSSPTNKEQEHHVGSNVSFPMAGSPTRQVTDESTAFSAASYDDEMLLSPIMYDDTLTSSPRSSFDHHTEGIKRRSVCFGETGKPIKPRSAFEQYTSSATPPTTTVL